MPVCEKGKIRRFTHRTALSASTSAAGRIQRAMTSDDDDDTPEIPIELWRTPEVFVYKVPPLKPGGHKASDWGLANPHLTGSLKLMAQGETVVIQVLSQEGKLFVACPIFLDKDPALPQSQLEYWVEVVKDSSRYFAVRALNANTKQVAIRAFCFTRPRHVQVYAADHARRAKKHTQWALVSASVTQRLGSNQRCATTSTASCGCAASRLRPRATTKPTARRCPSPPTCPG